jgi:major membrane immunogen (membrane-anchored lipoprotein)
VTNTLDDLFARDPDQLTRPDIQQIIAEFRDRRAQFKADEAAGKKPGKRKKAEAPVVNLADIVLKDPE